MHIRMLVAVLLVTGCVKKSTHQKALDENAQLKAQLATNQKTSGDEISRLQAQLATLGEAQKSRDAEIGRISGEKRATEKELADLRRQRDAAEKRIAAYKSMQQKFRALVDTGKLQVVFRNGQMTLKLPSSILFPSGSAELSKTGKAALADVIKVLLEFKDRRFMIAGHTDNLPIKSKLFKNNWYLSTARANSVVQFMIEQQFPAKNLAASGYGEFDPVAPNDNEQGREQNRRIELILVPNLEELPNLTGAQP